MGAITLFKQWWRPLGACLFIIAIFLRYMGWVSADIPETIELKILEIMKWYISLYVGGRTTEKIVDVVSKKVAIIRKPEGN